LLYLITKQFNDIPLTREEEGVGIAAGAVLAGAKPMMIVQSSGLGNMVNALLSLTQFYKLPLPIFISHRGVYKEKIAAQVPMGEHLPGILNAMDVEYQVISEPSDLSELGSELEQVFSENKIKCFLISPKICEGITGIELPYLDGRSGMHDESSKGESEEDVDELQYSNITEVINTSGLILSRIEALSGLKEYLKNKAVVCNMGFPSRELYSIFDQDSNFYMLGSLSLASSIGLGVAMNSTKEVVIIDGDGSILMNPNALFAIGDQKPKNLTLICLDNGSYGSTGNQPTLSLKGLKLEDLAKVSGFEKIFVTGTPSDIPKFITTDDGPRFVKLYIKPGNAKVGIIDIPPVELKNRFMNWLKK
jgi:sulfopyruvate decarboxylase subunit beta